MGLTAEQIAKWNEYKARWAALYADEVLPHPPYGPHGPQPDWRKALEFQQKHGEQQLQECRDVVRSILTPAGFVNPDSGDPTGAHENMGDANMQRRDDGSPGFEWFLGTDKNGVTVRVAIATEEMIAEQDAKWAARHHGKKGWYWRSNCYVEEPTAGTRERYARSIGSVPGDLISGVVNA